MKIVKAIIPAAGMGARFLPYTRSIPREMLPLLNKTVLQVVLEEIYAAGLEHYIFIARDQRHIGDMFCKQAVYDNTSKQDSQDFLTKLIKHSTISYVYQQDPLGSGHAVWLTRAMVEKEYCAIVFPDDLIVSDVPALAQIMRVARQEKASVIAVREVPEDAVHNYGIVSVKKQITPSLYQVGGLVEKPKTHEAPSNLAIIGRYVLSSKIFASLEYCSQYAQDELYLTDGIKDMLHRSERVFAYKVQGNWYDLGTPIEWLKANIHMAMEHAQYREQIEACLQPYTVIPCAQDTPEFKDSLTHL